MKNFSIFVKINYALRNFAILQSIIIEAIRLESCIRKLALFNLPQENKQIAHVLGVGSLIRGKGYASTSDTVSRVPRRFLFSDAVRLLYSKPLLL